MHAQAGSAPGPQASAHLQPLGGVDEGVRELKAVHLPVGARQGEGGAADGAAQVEGAARGGLGSVGEGVSGWVGGKG